MVFDMNDSELERATLKASNFINENIVIGNIHSIFFTAGEPSSGSETLKILNDCIDVYEANFENRMKTKPFTDVFEILQELKKEKKDALRWPFLDFLKSLEYDKIFALMRVFGGGGASKKVC